MFTRKKCSVGLDPDFGSVNTARTFNVRRQENWPAKVLHNVTDSVAAHHDEYDNQQHLFFEFPLPEPNNAQLFGPEEVLPSVNKMEEMMVITTVPRLKFRSLIYRKKLVCVKQENPVAPTLNVKKVDVIELSDDEDDDVMIVGEVKKTDPSSESRKTLRQRQINEKADILSSFLKEKGIEEQTVDVEKDKGHHNRLIVDGHLDKYVEVSTQENRVKTKFMLRKGDLNYIDHLIDPIPKRKKKAKKIKKEKKRPKKDKIVVSRMRSPSPILVRFSSDEDAPLRPMKTQSNSKKLPPAATQKRGSKFAKKTDDVAPKVSRPGELFVPRKDTKLRHSTVSSFLKTKEAEQQKQNLLKERKAREEELKRKEERKKKKARIESEKLRMSRKEGVPNNIDVSEPKKKKVRLNPPEEQIDILGAITDAMDAQKAVGKVADSIDESPRNGKEELVLPRMYDDPMVAPSVPPRFTVEGDDDMDISNSPETSPRVDYSREKPVSPTPSDEGIEVDRRARLEDDHSPTIGGNNELLTDNEGDQMNIDMSDLANLIEVEHYNNRNVRVEYRFKHLELDNVRAPVLGSSSNEALIEKPTVWIPCYPLENNEMISPTDPRIPGPSPNTLSKWKNARVPLNLEQQDYILPITRKEEEEDKTKKKNKKGVKWGENITKEFNPNDDNDDEMRPTNEKEKTTVEECTGEKEIGGKKYKIIKKVVADPVPPPPVPKPKSCLKPTPPVDPSSLLPPLPHFMRPSTSHSMDELDDEDDPFQMTNSLRSNPVPLVDPRRVIPPSLSSSGGTTKLPDFVPPPGYDLDGKKKEEEEKKRKEEERREKEEKEKLHSNNSSPEVNEGPSSSSSKSMDNGAVKMNQGPSVSFSIGNVNKSSSTMTTFGGASASIHLNKIPTRAPPVASMSYEKGSEIVGNRAPLPSYDVDDVKYQLEMRNKIVNELEVQKTIKDGLENEYPNDNNLPTCEDQLKLTEIFRNELTREEKGWKEDGIQPVWLQSLPYEANFSFKCDAGLYWPVVQPTDRIKDTDADFESMDVLRQLGNNTHFASEKKELLGIETRLPNGMTHKERFDSFFNGTKPEGRFKNRRMYSRVFSSQSEEEARDIHNEKMEKERQLLREHEELLKKNAPVGVTIKPCDMTITRPAFFKDFPTMIQYYIDDKYEANKPFSNVDWYCNRKEYYLPYTERAGYLCDVINHFNKPFNALYEDASWSSSNKWDKMVTLDKAAFVASQLAMDQMEGWRRVAVSEEQYLVLLKRHKERISLIESPSFDLDRYKELNVLIPLEFPYFHQIIDWISSIYKCIKPISEWNIERAIDSAFRDMIMISDEKDRKGDPRDRREVFYEAYKYLIVNGPSGAKKSRSQSECVDRRGASSFSHFSP